MVAAAAAAVVVVVVVGFVVVFGQVCVDPGSARRPGRVPEVVSSVPVGRRA